MTEQRFLFDKAIFGCVVKKKNVIEWRTGGYGFCIESIAVIDSDYEEGE